MPISWGLKVGEVLRRWLVLFKDTVRNLNEDDGFGIAAEASFYLMFSIFPLLFLILTAVDTVSASVPGWVWAENLTRTFPAYVPAVTRDFMTENLGRMMDQYRGIDVLLAGLLFLWPATSAFHAYADAVNTAYGLPEDRSYLRTRLVALLLFLGSGLIILLTSIAFGLLPLMAKILLPVSGTSFFGLLVPGARYLGAFLLITPSIALIYRFGPNTGGNKKLTIWPGAVFATVLWILSSQLFGFYLTHLDNYRVLYGALGGAMLLLLWIYLTSLAILLGAEFNYTCQQDRSRE